MATNGALNIFPYWRAVQKVEATLQPGTTGTVFITSIERPLSPAWRAGVTFETTRRIAAQRIVEQTHRIATAEEIEAYRAAKKQREQDLRVETQLRQQKEVRVIAVDRQRLIGLGEV